MRTKLVAGAVATALVAMVLAMQPGPVQAASSLVIYDDAFRNGFVHNRWNGRNDIANRAPVKVGTRSIATTPSPWTGIFIDIPNGAALRNTTTLRFWINGGSGGLGPFMVTAMRDVNKELGYHRLPAVRPDAWALIEIPYTALGA